MRRTLAVLLSLAMAFGALFCCAGTAFAADRRYELPKSIQGQDKFVGDKTEWNMAVSYNRNAKTLVCESTGEDKYDALYAYLYNMSTDSEANRFLDRKNSTSTLVGSRFKDLLSVDPIRYGKIKYIVLTRKDKEGKYLTGVYSFETKDGRVTHSTVVAPKNYYSQLAQVEARYEYDREGKLTKITKTNLSLDVPSSVEAVYSYDTKGRPSNAEINSIDFEKGVSISSSKLTYHSYNDIGWPTAVTEVDSSDGDEDTEKFRYTFDVQGRMESEGRLDYFYDEDGRLVRSERLLGNLAKNGTVIMYKDFFKI